MKDESTQHRGRHTMSKDKNPPNNIIKFPNSEDSETRLIELDGVIEVPISITIEEFEEVFDEFLQTNQWGFEGGVEDITDE